MSLACANIKKIKKLIHNQYGLDCDLQEFHHTWGYKTHRPSATTFVINNEMDVLEAVARDPFNASNFVFDPNNETFLKDHQLLFYGDLYKSGYDAGFISDPSIEAQSIRNWYEYRFHNRDPHVARIQALNAGIRFKDILFSNIHVRNAVVGGIDGEFIDTGLPVFVIGDELTTNFQVSPGLTVPSSLVLDPTYRFKVAWNQRFAFGDVGTIFDFADATGSGYYIDLDATGTIRIYVGDPCIEVLAVDAATLTAAGVVLDGVTFNSFIAHFWTVGGGGEVGLYYTPDGVNYCQIALAATPPWPALTAPNIGLGTIADTSPAASVGFGFLPTDRFSGNFHVRSVDWDSAGTKTTSPFIDLPGNSSFHFVGYKIRLRGGV